MDDVSQYEVQLTIYFSQTIISDVSKIKIWTCTYKTNKVS